MYLLDISASLRKVYVLFVSVIFLLLQACATNSGGSTGSNMKSDPNKADQFSVVLKAAEQGDASSQAELANIYAQGIGFPKNYSLAFEWNKKAVAQGNARAQANLGYMYQIGLGVAKDERLAVDLYRKSAAQGYANGQSNLGGAYLLGSGVIKDELLAMEWFRKAAVQGFARGQANLGNMYEKGLGRGVNTELAYFWYLMALMTDSKLMLQLDSNATRLVKLESLLTSPQKLEIQETASTWVVGDAEPTFKFKIVPTARAESQPAPNVAPASPTPRSSPQPASRVTPNPAPPTPSKPNTPPPSGSPKGTGSGFRVSSNQVVTNAHVVAGCSRLRVNGLAANLQTSDKQVDLALITVNGLAGTIANIRSDAVRVGEDVAVAGYPLRGLLSGFNITRGNVSSLTGLGGARWVFQITAPVQPGNSGGPLVDGTGNVAGVVVSKLSWKAAIALDDIPQNVNFAVNLGALQNFLKANSVRYQSASSGNTQMNLADVAEQAKHYSALVECL